MATYTVSYRNKNGERIEEQFDAPDRNSLFKILSDRKISAISVKDGAAPKRKKSSATAKPVPPSALRGVCAGIVVVVLGVALFLVFGNRGEMSQVGMPTKNGLIKEYPFEPSKVPTDAVENAGEVFGKGNEVELPSAGAAHSKASMNVGQKATLRGPKQRYEEALKKGRRALFTNECDQWLSQYAIPGEVSPPPPISESTKAAFALSVADKIEITEEDSPRDREIKEGVIALRAELSQWIKDGGKLEDYMDKLQKRQESEHEYICMAQEMISNEFDESDGNIDNVLELWRATNKKLEADGLRKMRLPARIRVAMGRAGMQIPEE